MTEAKANKTELSPSATVDEHFVIGLDKDGKPQGARFKKCDDRVAAAAFDMLLINVYPASPTFAELGMKLPQGRLYSSGKTFIPNIKRDLYDKLRAILASPNDGSTALQLERAQEKAEETQVAASAESAVVPCLSPTIAGLPRSWDTIGVGHMVLMHAGAADGWWECVVTAREGDILTLRYRDYPKEPAMVRHISAVALVNPGPA